MCKPALLMFCIWNSRLGELQLICSAQSSKAQRTQTASFLPREEPSSSSSASRRPQICPSCGGGELASRKERKQRPAGTRMQWRELAAKNRHSQLPQGVLLAEDVAGQRLFWPLRAERTSNAPMPEQGSSQLSQLHCGASAPWGCTTSKSQP